SGLPHSIQALEPGAEFLLVFDDGSFSENSTFQVTDWLAHTPEEVVLKNFGMTKEQFDKLPEKEKYIFQKGIPGSLECDKVKT
ncbi:cupin domain-containing protein, partial [Bacillus sp. WOD8 KX774193]